MEAYPETTFGSDSDTKFWKSEREGDEIVGVYLGTKRGGKYGNKLARIRDDGGEENLVSVTRALEDIESLPAGTRCRIKFLGWGESKTGTKFKKFSIFTVGEVEALKREPPADEQMPGTFAATSEDVPF